MRQPYHIRRLGWFLNLIIVKKVKILENTVSKELEIIDLKNDAKVSGLWWQVASFTAPLAIFEFVFHFNDIDFGAIKNLIKWFN